MSKFPEETIQIKWKINGVPKLTFQYREITEHTVQESDSENCLDLI